MIGAWRTSRAESKERKIEFIRLQLQELYGPLQFFTSCNAQLFSLNRQFHEALTHEYINKQYSQEYNAQERVREAVSQTIDIANQYIV